MAIMLLQIILIPFLLKTVQSSESYNISLPGCPDSCGGVLIPYPFGIGDKCSLSEHFNVTCDKPLDDKLMSPYLQDIGYVVDISIPLGQARIHYFYMLSECYNTTTKKDDFLPFYFGEDYSGSPYVLNNERNEFMVIGCNAFATLTIENSTVGCLSTCDGIDSLKKYGSSCSGIGCCKAAIPRVTDIYLIRFDERYNHSEVYNFSACSYATIVEKDKFQFNTDYVSHKPVWPLYVPIIFDWVMGNTTCKKAQTNQSTYACKSDHSVCKDYENGPGYRCNCSSGYEGNPYLQGSRGCQDINECSTGNPCPGEANCYNLPGTYLCSPPKCAFWMRLPSNSNSTCQLNSRLVAGSCAGFVALSFLGFAMYIILQRRTLSKLKQKYFRQHGGWILLEQIRLNQGFGFTIFTEQQVKQATNNFDNANIIGRGGNGTVYKGKLKDQIVAIKRCKIINESKKKKFGKEMLILSLINHKNIVKLLGCCLEVEVPILVYEFIPNGTLYQYIHHKKQGSYSYVPLTIRLRIAHESAEALAYLHTLASPPIIHGDVKSANILLDQNYTAKVSDFGASILAPTDESQFVTFVQGTIGYLDPEYMQTSKLTDKSDVYSFGVVLVEILTGKPVIGFDEQEEERSLASRFLSAMQENKLQELLDDEINYRDDLKLIREVAELAKACLSMKGEERPTMKEVTEELQRISKLKQHPWEREFQEQEYNSQETMLLLGEGSGCEIETKHTGYSFNVDKEAEESIATGR